MPLDARAVPQARLGIAAAGLLVFVASAAILILELVAVRLLSPFVGVSLDTWTAIIGVALAGISVGNWIGGRVADRYPSIRTAALLVLLGSVTSLAILGIIALLGDGGLVRGIPLLPRIFLLSMIAFFPPCLFLGMVTPVAIKLALPDVTRTGRVVGLIYALGTLGSLAGNYLTGFVLVAYMPVNAIVLAVSGVLFLLLLLTAVAGRRAVPVGGQVGQWASGPVGGGPSSGEDSAPPARPGPLPPTAQLAPAGRLDLRGNLRLGSAVVVMASFFTMAIELTASRILAPHVGVSLYTWTGIFGVVLAGIAIGNYLGGRLADRWPRQGVLGACLLLGGLTSLAIPFLTEAVTQAGLFGDLGLMQRIVVLTASLFLVPVVLLGTISPQVIKLAMTDLGHAGRVSGRIYAWSTAGAIAGTFATGWWLISLIGVYSLILIGGLGLVGLAVTVGRFWRSTVTLAASGAVTLAVASGLYASGAFESPCTRETNYFCIKVIDTERDGHPVKALVLDHLIHSYVKLGDPSYLGYEHEIVQAEVTRLVAERREQPEVLLIGGGAYTYPRWVETFLPQASIEVVEIDPGVTEVAYEYFGLPEDTRIVSYNMDGRQFVHEMAPPGSYDLVVMDAVDDLSVPFHLLTREFNELVGDLLAEDGIYLLSVIDLYEDGQLLRAAVRTMKQTFPHVHLLAPYAAWDTGGAAVFVVYGSERPLDVAELEEALWSQAVPRQRTLVLADERLQEYVQAGSQIVLTDQYAPVDNLISLLFERRR